ncbi:MAG TPA: O-methyltransferase [Saprospiraceae bacterium]|nr:O-methyltransferase [Saprospiraceae bacterium]HMP24058.1 O-methyltransferase [Saprospiraceae bacterium]
MIMYLCPRQLLAQHMDKHSFNKLLHDYCAAHTTPPDPVLQALERETHLKTLAPQMLSGHLQGQLLQLLSSLLQPKSILEIGTFTGYAAICLARGLAPGGRLHTIEPNRELEHLIRKYIALAGLEAAIQLHIGRAEEMIPVLDISFDLVFIDAGKQQNAFFYDLIFDKVRPGGLILIDNVLWGGKIVNERAHDVDTQLIRTFNDKIHADERVENIMLPIRDGLLIARKH